MKQAILGTGIGWGILCIITAAILIPVGAVATNPEIINSVVQQGKYTEQEVIQAAQVLQVFFISFGITLLIGAVFSFLFVGLRNAKFGKGVGITLGVFGIVFGATLPAVFFIVDSARTRP